MVRMRNQEAEAIRRVLAGDRDAYHVLVAAHYQFAFRLAFRITGDEHDAEEVTQEAFLRAYTRLATFRLDSSFSTWVNRIAMNTALNLVERRKRDALHTGDSIHAEAGASEWILPDGRPGPERLLLDRETNSLRQTAMAALTPMERTAFTLRHMEDMPIAHIAEALRVPANSAKQAVFRAVSKLRQALAPNPTTGSVR